MRDYKFAVIDPLALDVLPEAMITETLVPKRLMQSAHLMPALIDLQQVSEAQWSEFRTCLHDARNGAQTSSAAILIATSSGLQEFVRHWNAIQLARPSRRHKFWFRIHDSRVLHQLLRILNPIQRRGLFGQARAFHYWIGNGWTTALRDQESESGKHLPSIGPVGWDWPRIEQISVVNRALLGAGIHDLSALTTHGALAEQLIKRAIIRHGLSDKADLVEYATRGLLCGPLFDEHPGIARAIQIPAESEEPTSLSDRFSLIEDEVWASFDRTEGNRI